MSPGPLAPSIRLLALDIDGTLAARGDHVTARTREALGRAASAGISVVVATGRRHRTAQPVVASLGLPVPTICLGGALTKCERGTTLAARSFRPEILACVAERIRARGLALVAQRDSQAPGEPDFLIDDEAPWNESTRSYFDANLRFARRVRSPAREPRGDVLVAGCFGPREELLALARELESSLSGAVAAHVLEGLGLPDHHCQILPAGVSKWEALEHLAALRGIPPEAVCAVGDEVNDLEMIRGAGLGVAMGNAAPGVRAAADLVIGRHDEDGLVGLVDGLLRGTVG